MDSEIAARGKGVGNYSICAIVLRAARTSAKNSLLRVAELVTIAPCLTAFLLLFGAPYHPQTQGKIERRHQTPKNRILLERSYLPRDLERQVAAFVEHCNHARYHESLDNLTPADVYFGRGEGILLERERIKRQTIAERRLQHRLQAA